MKKNFNRDDFESFLSDAAEGHSMYPSDRVWQAIDKKLERQRRWPALGFGAALLGTIVMGVLFYAQPDKADLKSFSSKKNSIQKTIESPANAGSAVNADADISALFSNGVVDLPPGRSAGPTAGGQASVSYAAGFGKNAAASETGVIPSTQSTIVDPIKADPELAIADNYFTGYASPKINLSINPLQVADERTLDYTGNSGVIIPAKKLKSAQKWSTMVYVTPSSSYRFINETSTSSLPVAFSANTVTKLKNLVNHRSILGFEAGLAFIKPISEKANFRIGVQANYRGFEIDAWEANSAIATIRTSNSASTQTRQMVGVASNDPAGNFRSLSLRNTFVQASIPVGFDLAINSNRKTDIIIGSSIQPTLTLAQKSYLLASDYKNYVQQPDLMRRFTVNSSVELALRVKGKSLNWQVGPQIRYQLTPTAKPGYSIKENLIDYGFKIGISKTH